MSKKTLRERLESYRPTPSEEAAASRLRSAARERLRSAVEAIDHRERALTDGELDEFAVLLEARAETGYDFERMESMPAADFDRLVRMILRRRRKAGDRDATIPPDTTKHDQKNDHPKKPEKKRRIRPMNAAAADCARRYRAEGGQFPMKTVVEDYVAEHGGSAETLLRILNDNPVHWKDDPKPTK